MLIENWSKNTEANVSDKASPSILMDTVMTCFKCYDRNYLYFNKGILKLNYGYPFKTFFLFYILFILSYFLSISNVSLWFIWSIYIKEAQVLQDSEIPIILKTYRKSFYIFICLLNLSMFPDTSFLLSKYLWWWI